MPSTSMWGMSSLIGATTREENVVYFQDVKKEIDTEGMQTRRSIDVDTTDWLLMELLDSYHVLSTIIFPVACDLP